MNGFLIRWLVNALAIYVTTRIVKGIDVDSISAAVVAALILGIANAVVKPVLVVLSLPVTFASLGLFLLVINGFLLMMVSSVVPGFQVHGFLAAVIGSIVIGFFSYLISGMLGTG